MNNQFQIFHLGAKICADEKMSDGIAYKATTEPHLAHAEIIFMGEGQWLHTVCVLLKIDRPTKWLFSKFDLNDDTLRIACKYATFVINGMIPYIVSINESWYELHMMVWRESRGYELRINSNGGYVGSILDSMPRRSGVDIFSDEILKGLHKQIVANPQAIYDGPKMPRAWHDEIGCYPEPQPPAFYERVNNLKGYNIFSGLEYFKLNGDPDWMTPGYEVEMLPIQIYVDESFYRTPYQWQIFKRWIINLYRHALHNRKRSDK